MNLSFDKPLLRYYNVDKFATKKVLLTMEGSESSVQKYYHWQCLRCSSGLGRKFPIDNSK